ncbi:hypothetical protein, partial [Lampropedia aestuarii]|uniref:hypothetical protein n=1 Tax=Lampropedia aestuarii TaxID=2562762 RepID=UPI0019824344
APNPLSWIDPWGGVRTNAASGKKHADLVTQKAQSKYGPQNVQTEVYIRPLDNNGNPVNYRVRADNTVGSAKSPDFIIESKGSPNAPLTKNQKKGYPLIDRNGGIIKQGSGKDKISTPISSTPHKIIRPRDIDKI